MMRFDWERFLRSRRFEYTPSTKRQITLRCPFCGESDFDGDNMSVNLDGKGWRCWRSPASHYGRSPVGLVRKLLGCTEEEAHEIVGIAATPPPPASDVMAANLARLRGTEHVLPTRRRLELPAKTHPLDPDDPRAEPFVRYLEEVRGYRLSEVRWLAETYDLHYATLGPYKWRIIFPVRGRRGELLTWTARAIGSTTELRYKQPPTAEVITEAPHTLLGLDRLWSEPNPRVLVATEGPLDAARISVSGAHLGVWGTCLFGLGLSDEQCILLDELSAHFPKIALLLDPDADRARLRMARQLFPLQVSLPCLPPGVADPGALTAGQASELCMSLLAAT